MSILNVNIQKQNAAQNGMNQIEALDKQDIFKMVKEAYDTAKYGSEENQKRLEESINRKINSGQKLTEKEMNYIRAKNPAAYKHVLRVQTKREAFENKLKNCKSKEEVKEAYDFEILHISKDDPDIKAIISATDNAVMEFKKTSEYKGLPEKVQEEETKTKSETAATLYELCANGYQESYISEESSELNLDLRA